MRADKVGDIFYIHCDMRNEDEIEVRVVCPYVCFFSLKSKPTCVNKLLSEIS